jgi:hypothetical protein
MTYREADQRLTEILDKRVKECTENEDLRNSHSYRLGVLMSMMSCVLTNSQLRKFEQGVL